MDTLVILGVALLAIGCIGYFVRRHENKQRAQSTENTSSPSGFGPGSGDVGPVDKV